MGYTRQYHQSAFPLLNIHFLFLFLIGEEYGFTTFELQL